VKHRYALLGALAIGAIVAFLMVGHARGAEPAGVASPPPAASSWPHRLDGPLDVTVAAAVVDPAASSTDRRARPAEGSIR
jgi:hypothetical protein